MRSAVAASDRIQHLRRYKQQLHSPVTVMHESSARNFRDYFCYFAVASGLSLCALLLLSSEKRLYVVAPILGAGAALTAAHRDSQYRSVPPSLAATPRKFAAEVETALDSTLAQLVEAETLAQQLKAATEQFSADFSGAKALISAEPEASSNYLGKGFE